MSQEDCIFCKIAKGEIPAHVVYEDDDVIAFDDLNPVMPVHTLIIPKQHFSSLSDPKISAEVLGAAFSKVATVAEEKGLSGGYRVLVNTGDDAGQTVHHLHIHVIGGGKMTDPTDQDWGEFAINSSN